MSIFYLGVLAKAGVQSDGLGAGRLDSRFRGNDCELLNNILRVIFNPTRAHKNFLSTSAG